MKRSKKIVLEAPEGYYFYVSSSEGGCLGITLIPTGAGNYTDPPIPEGWEYVEGKWDCGFVIQDSKGNQFVWVPVGSLDANGTLDGTNFSEKFGRRNYKNDIFSKIGFKEELEEELCKQLESVQKYGGFYISRYNISKNKQTGEAQSVKGVLPWTDINCFDAMKAAKTFGDGVSVTSHLPFGAEYDSTLEWFIKSRKRTEKEIKVDSTQWGNFTNPKNASREVAKTGTREEWSTNNICDLAGNVAEWTQEKKEGSCRVIRGGDCTWYGGHYPVSNRRHANPDKCFSDTGFRATLCLA